MRCRRKPAQVSPPASACSPSAVSMLVCAGAVARKELPSACRRRSRRRWLSPQCFVAFVWAAVAPRPAIVAGIRRGRRGVGVLRERLPTYCPHRRRGTCRAGLVVAVRVLASDDPSVVECRSRRLNRAVRREAGERGKTHLRPCGLAAVFLS